MTARGRTDLVDLIHDAPFNPALWVPVMERLCDAIGAQTAVMTELDILSGQGALLPARQPASVVDDYLQHWATRNPLQFVPDPVAYLNDWRPLILRDGDWIDRDDLRRTPFWNEFLHPLGAGQSIIVRLGLEGTIVSSVSIGRHEQRGAFEPAEIRAASRYHRDLVRAMRTARQLRLTQDGLDDLDALLATTDQLLIFVDRARRVRRFSVSAERELLGRGVLRLVGRRLSAPNPAEDDALQDLVGKAADGDAAPASITIGAARSGHAYRLSAVPLGPRSLAVLTDERFVLLSVVAEPAGKPPALSREIDLRRRFGLTAAEARVATAIAGGLNVRQTAEQLGVSVHTVRAQLGTIFGKTATRRQAELVRLVLAAGPATP